MQSARDPPAEPGQVSHTRGMTTNHVSEVVRLADLATVNPVIDGHNFENCLIVGPAVMLVMSGTAIEGCDLGGDAVSIFWLVNPEVRNAVLGAIGVQNCSFRGCRFQNVGLAGPEELRTMLWQDATRGVE